MDRSKDKIELLPELQKSQVMVLKRVITFFGDHSIQYYLTGGSVLGTTYYKGFLPYDDDIDIAIPRDDYIRLIYLIRNDPKLFGTNTLTKHYSLDEKFDYPIIKVFNLDFEVTSLLDDEHSVSYPFLDIAPLDGAPIDPIKRRHFDFKFKILAKAYAYSTKKINPNGKSKLIYNIQIKLAAFINYLFKRDPLYFLKKLDNLIAQNKVEESDFAGTLLGRYGLKELLPITDWGQGSVGIFEKLQVILPQRVDQYINDLYGGYREYSQEEFLRERHIIILGRGTKR